MNMVYVQHGTNGDGNGFVALTYYYRENHRYRVVNCGTVYEGDTDTVRSTSRDELTVPTARSLVALNKTLRAMGYRRVV